MSSTPEIRAAAPRYPCPVCLGVQMAKLRPDAGLDLELDHCERCGGMWFEKGEVELLRRSSPQALATRVKIGAEAWTMRCHDCHAAMNRNWDKCPACGWRNVLLCPHCQKALAPVQHEGLRLDVCRSCRGAWFDNVELAEIWNRSVTAVARRHGRGLPAQRDLTTHFFLDAFFWSSIVPFPGSLGSASSLPDAAGGIIGGGAGVDGVDGIGDIAGNVVDGAGEVAGGVFTWVAEFIANFDF